MVSRYYTGVFDFLTDSVIMQCGGAQTRTRPTARRRRVTRGKRREVVPSNHTGRQTERKRKAGARVTSKYAFTGEGVSLAGGSADDKKKGKGKRAVR